MSYERDLKRLTQFRGARPEYAADLCHSAKDGECRWDRCPQSLDGEPTKTGRHCPLDCYEEL